MNRSSQKEYRIRLDPERYRQLRNQILSGMVGSASPAAGAINFSSITSFTGANRDRIARRT